MFTDLTEEEKERSNTILQLARDRVLAHQVLFKHRHSNTTPPFHKQFIKLWHSQHSRVLMMAFRGAAKSTLAEEGIIINACFAEFKNGLLLGETYDRACERLTSIKNEFENNPYIEDLFGSLVGPVWQEGKIVLTTGIIIQAFGRGQSLRGSKYLDQRPDKVFGDDIENDEAAQTPDARRKTKEWFWGTVLPALDPNHTIRVAATPLDADALPASLQHKAGFKTIKVPIYTVNEEGNSVASWPDRFPLTRIEELKKEMYRLGLSHKWQQEYMCEAEDPTQKPFTADLFKVRSQVKTWQATWAFYDPARSVKTTSATTGVAIWSWINNRLVVWDAYGKLWKPDEIIEDIFKVNESFSPIAIGVEPDGLEEFIMQPLRQAQVKYGEVVPFRPIRAPKSKLDFIRGLQPFFKAGEIEFAKDLPDLTDQLLSFPTGRIDVPNALAYALKMRPGLPIYEDFDVKRHVEEGLRYVRSQRSYVALNAAQYCVSAIVFQYIDGVLHILYDVLREGEPNQSLSYIISDVGLFVGKGQCKYYCPVTHFSPGDIIGLRGAARSVGIELNPGGAIPDGRNVLNSLLQASRRQGEAVLVSPEARRTLNALSGGYARALNKQGQLMDEPDDTVYRVLMEGLESVLAFTVSTQEEQGNYEYAADGRRYLSARVAQ